MAIPLRSAVRSAPAKGGWPGFDAVLKFKMLVLQALEPRRPSRR